MKLFLMFFLLISFAMANAQTKTTILTNFSPSAFGEEVILLTIPLEQQTKSEKITYVKSDYGNGKYAIIGYGRDNNLSYVATNKLSVAKDAISVYNNYTKNGDTGSQSVVGPCSWCACVKACAIQCSTNWCNVACLIGCIP